MFVLFILGVVAAGNVSKCEVNFLGAKKKKEIKLEQWPSNHLSKVGEYINGYLLIFFLH